MGKKSPSRRVFCRNQLVSPIAHDTMTTKPTHGGARQGAGRLPSSKARRSLTIRLSEPARDRLDEIKRATGESSSSVLERALRLL